MAGGSFDGSVMLESRRVEAVNLAFWPLGGVVTVAAKRGWISVGTKDRTFTARLLYVKRATSPSYLIIAILSLVATLLGVLIGSEVKRRRSDTGM